MCVARTQVLEPSPIASLGCACQRKLQSRAEQDLTPRHSDLKCKGPKQHLIPESNLHPGSFTLLETIHTAVWRMDGLYGLNQSRDESAGYSGE